MQTKSDALRSWALAQVGSPYVMGGTGQKCTPSYRQARAEQYPGSAAAIRSNCPVLRGKKADCGSCKYDGKRCYDCAQLVRRGCAAAGIEGVAISGATSQWNKGDWLRKGGVEDAPSGKMCILFREDKPAREAARPTKPEDSADEALRRAVPSTGESLGWAKCVMGHTGIALGDGTRGQVDALRHPQRDGCGGGRRDGRAVRGCAWHRRQQQRYRAARHHPPGSQRPDRG